MALAGQFPGTGGRPLRRRRGKGTDCGGPTAARDRSPPGIEPESNGRFQPARCSAACSFLRLRSIIHATKMQSS